MSFLSFIAIGNILLILFNICETVVCPSSYNSIFNGCYKVNEGTDLTWSDARQYCINDTNRLGISKARHVTHLLAFESATETKSLTFWMKAWNIHSSFWIDGIVSSSSWDWSGQPITWYFNASDITINNNGSNYQIFYDTVHNSYTITDNINNKLLPFICEYQDTCGTNNSCQNNATCYLNVGRELCICAAGFTGILCDEQIDECLSSPCQHGGECIDGPNNYTCDCSDVFFHGSNCETPDNDPTKAQRSAAFWTVFSIVSSLVVLLTLSDLPWSEICTAIGCPWYRFKCCSNRDIGDEDEDEINVNNHRSIDSPINESNLLTKEIILPGTKAKGTNYHVMDVVWNPEHSPNEIPPKHQFNEYRSLDESKTPNNILIQSFASGFIAKEKEKKLQEKSIYAVDIVEQNNSTSKMKNPADTMISWTQQLQEQLKSKQSRPISASSTRQLIQTDNNNEN
ncbi:unnamed protein product [Rotaria magnacalcarata]|uniref:EGF-like domain-containing protein n=1 Tax=Rotaria magnacalcarata TaxID=392030 RepID=A0A816NPQ1_9BILA|nr:unnamed protein product [Rotaria magnacalcarata]CAF2089984.1 unnamed protein product [Rotaria magnacalcarata]CAF4105686.1 unnamed protein product [Rotaria magnacalcarata]CAF4138575.1 unnamed protein product [Rotaria magnacalcarata]